MINCRYARTGCASMSGCAFVEEEAVTITFAAGDPIMSVMCRRSHARSSLHIDFVVAHCTLMKTAAPFSLASRLLFVDVHVRLRFGFVHSPCPQEYGHVHKQIGLHKRVSSSQKATMFVHRERIGQWLVSMCTAVR